MYQCAYAPKVVDRGFFMVETFADYVKRHRKHLDMKQEKLAVLANISQSYVSGIERGINVEVDPEHVKSIATALRRPHSEALKVAFPNAQAQEPDSKDDSTFTVSVDTSHDSNPLIHKLAMDAAHEAAQDTARRAYATTVGALQGFTAHLTPEEFEQIMPRLINWRRLPSGEQGVPSIVTPMENPATQPKPVDETCP